MFPGVCNRRRPRCGCDGTCRQPCRSAPCGCAGLVPRLWQLARPYKQPSPSMDWATRRRREL